jgi:uncharacterized SAM-binding protein YcdF (DUF218 family)
MVGLWYLYRNKIQKAKKILTFSFIFIVLISYAPFANLLIKPLEQYYPKLNIENIPKDVKYVLILGGDIDARSWEIMRLYTKIPNLKIITSGRSILKKISEAKETQIRLIECGVKKQDIMMNEKAKDTQEEVGALKNLIGITPFILVTSAYHLPRSMLMFQSQGLNPIPAPTDFQVADTDSLTSIPSITQLNKTQIAWHEYMGIIWYILKEKLK